MRGISHIEANDANVVSDTLFRPMLCRIRRTAPSMRSSEGDTPRSSTPPALVNSTVRVWWLNSGTATSLSSVWICRLTADCVGASSFAAA